ncbi:hypothetical protein [Streptomyces vinaceus]|uniref:hypothetical protein n=1 Tax=Streptomyces vinaceus TaxID=1960 RepID=UPI00368E7C50
MESEPTLRNRGGSAHCDVQGRIDIAFDIDAGWAAVTKARERGDVSGEALALTVLGQALQEAGRTEEARFFHDQADETAPSSDVWLFQAEILMKRGIELAETGGDPETTWGNWFGKDERNAGIIRQREWALSGAGYAFDQAARIFQNAGTQEQSRNAAIWKRETLPRRIRHLMGPLESRPSAKDDYPSRDQAPSSSPRTAEVAQEAQDGAPGQWGNVHAAPVPAFEEIVVGFLAVKLLGPFLETFATKLGERFGESTSQALGRIRVTRRRNRTSRNLEIEDPQTFTSTVLVLPEEFTEEARLAVIELDVSAEEVRGKTLRWNPDTSTWQVVDDGPESSP